MKFYRKWVMKFVLTVLFFVSTVGVANYAVDPYQLFRKDVVFNKNQRYANVGLARHNDYDSIIVGSSMTENFSPRYINEVFKANIINLSLSGGTAFEERLVVEAALRSRKVNFVIWGLDYPSFRGEANMAHPDYEMPVYLYDDNPVNDFKCLLCLDTLKLSWKKIANKWFGKPCKEFCTDLDNVYNWYDAHRQNFTKKHYWGSWRQRAFARHGNNANAFKEYRFELMRKSFDANLMRLVRENPGTVFYIFYPPYSSLFHYQYYEASRERFNDILDFKKYVFERLSECNNARLYDFQVDSDITNNISLYKDLKHFNPDINKHIIDSIIKGEFLVTSENVDRYIGILRKNTESLDAEARIRESENDESGRRQ